MRVAIICWVQCSLRWVSVMKCARHGTGPTPLRLRREPHNGNIPCTMQEIQSSLPLPVIPPPPFQPRNHCFKILHRWKKCSQMEGAELSLPGPFTSVWRSPRSLWHTQWNRGIASLLCWAFHVLLLCLLIITSYFQNNSFCTRICDEVVSLIPKSFVFAFHKLVAILLGKALICITTIVDFSTH